MIISFAAIFVIASQIRTHRHQDIEHLINNTKTYQDSCDVLRKIDKYRISYHYKNTMYVGVSYYDNKVNSFLNN